MATDAYDDNTVDDTLDALRDQRDDAADSDLQGEVQVNPQAFVTGKRLVIPNIMFGTSFSGRPNLTFGDIPLQVGVYAPVEPTSTADNSPPFLVHAYVSSFMVTNGVFEGFNLGLYALTDVPGGVTTHLVWWKANGKASTYGDQDTDVSWTEAYDYNDADYLTESADESDYVDDSE